MSFNFSCRKEYIHAPVTIDSIPQSQPGKISRQFFNTHLPSDESIIAVRNNLLRQEKQKPFVDRFVKYAGYPLWDKAIIKTGIENRISANGQREDIEGKLIFIPIATDSIVKAILKVNIHANDTTFKMLYRWQYNAHGYGKNKKFNNASQTALLFMGMESYAFGHHDFKINDSLLFRKNDTAIKRIHIKSFNQNEPNLRMELVRVSICYEETVSQYDADCPPMGGGVLPTEMICVDYNLWVDVGGGEDDGSGYPPPDSSPGTSGGGSDDGGGWQDDPCNPSGNPNIPAMRIGQLAPCDGGGSGSGEGDPWLPVLPEDDSRDANGYLYTRISELQNILQTFPQALEPCDSLNIMPLETYGAMWQNVAQFTPSSLVKNRIDSIRNVAPNFIVDNFNEQSLTDAYGAIVNCDYFPVRITQMPPGMAPEYLLEFFRKNINSFIDPNLGMTFGPYIDGSFNDTQKYNSPYDGSIGSLWHLDLGSAPGLDGSVVESGYYHEVNGNYQSHYFTVTTMETPLDFEHPVAGNRRWGIFFDPDHPGEFDFYTMGVDRIWDATFDFGNWLKEKATKQNGFDDADKLWTSLQKEMIQFIKDNGGNATYYSNHKTTARPKWNDVEEYLKGNIDFPELKRRLGC